MSLIYLIQHKDIPEYTKIGHTDNLERRVKILENASPTGIKVVYSQELDDAQRLENALHRRYAKFRSNLEWFKLSNEQILEIIFEIDEYAMKMNEKKQNQ